MPMCSSWMKNCEAGSSSATTSGSRTVSEPIPASTRFFAISFAIARMPIRRILELRILGVWRC